jgi:hypothetical protein
MPNVAELLRDLISHGVEVRIECGSVKLSANKGAITPDQVAALRTRKAEIIEFLEAANDQPAEPVKPYAVDDGYKPFDWGPSDPFKRFRRTPDLLRG